MKKKEPLLTIKEIFVVVLIIVLVFFQVLSQLELPSYSADIIDVGIYNEDLPYIYNQGAIMLLIAFISIVASISASFFASRIGVSVGTKLRTRIFTKVSSFSLQEYNKFGASTLITRNTNDVIQVQNFTTMMLRLMVMAPMMLIGGIIMSYRQSSELAFVFWYAIPVIIIAIIIVAYIAIPLFKKLQEKLDNVNLVFRENLIGVRVVRAFNRYGKEKERFSKTNKEHVDVAKKVNRIIMSVQPIMMIIMNLTALAIVYFGAVKIDEGAIQLGSIFAFLQYAMQILFSLVMASMIFIMLPRAQASFRRINEILNEELIITDKESAETLEHVKGEITFKNVMFKYPGAEMPVLSNVSFTASPGKITAIVGGTGSGKSTLINLIPRFYDITSGDILIDGKSILDVTQHSLRSQIGYIPQTATLFSGSIKHNLIVGNENATDEFLKEVIEVAQASEFIDFEGEGLEKNVSQSGTNLSGGQKQRLSIARAIVKDPKIYIFDDSFSALDFNTDFRLRKALNPYFKNATVFIVAQRISTIINADQIVVLDEGLVVGIGTHDELMKTCEVYNEIVSSQVTEEELAHE